MRRSLVAPWAMGEPRGIKELVLEVVEAVPVVPVAPVVLRRLPQPAAVAAARAEAPVETAPGDLME